MYILQNKISGLLPTHNEINSNNKFCFKSISSSKLAELWKNNIIKPAFCQNAQNDIKIENLLNSYKKDNGMFIHLLRNEISFCVYSGENKNLEYFNIDGQHRMLMGIKLWKKS
jgi:hypothetical protein